AGVVERNVLVAAVGVAGVDEHDTLQADTLYQWKDDLVVEDDFLAPADGSGRHDLAHAVLALLARTERAGLEAADRVDAAREVALEERQLVAREATVTDAVAEGGPE